MSQVVNNDTKEYNKYTNAKNSRHLTHETLFMRSLRTSFVFFAINDTIGKNVSKGKQGPAKTISSLGNFDFLPSTIFSAFKTETVPPATNFCTGHNL